jgi:hypothetical protein
LRIIPEIKGAKENKEKKLIKKYLISSSEIIRLLSDRKYSDGQSA